jgi:tetratricopeptide (TPR) repeat protein
MSIVPMVGGLVFLLLTLSPARVCLARSLTIDADAQYAYAQHLFQEGRFDEAAHEFGRFIFFFPHERRVPQARFETGRCLFNLKRFSAAESAFLTLLALTPGGPVATRIRFMIVDCRVREGNPEAAVRMLRYLIGHATRVDERDEAWRRLGWILVDGTRWHEAREAFEHISRQGKNRFRLDPLLSELETAQAIPQKSPAMAGVLSIVPGAGHLYCGRPHDAAIAFFLNAALIGTCWEAFDRDLPWLGSLLLITESGIYSGTIYSAVNCAHKYNRDQKLSFIRRLHRSTSPGLSLDAVPGGFAISFHLSFN